MEFRTVTNERANKRLPLNSVTNIVPYCEPTQPRIVELFFITWTYIHMYFCFTSFHSDCCDSFTFNGLVLQCRLLFLTYCHGHSKRPHSTQGGTHEVGANNAHDDDDRPTDDDGGHNDHINKSIMTGEWKSLLDPMTRHTIALQTAIHVISVFALLQTTRLSPTNQQPRMHWRTIQCIAT